MTVEEVSEPPTPGPAIVLLECHEGRIGEEMLKNELLNFLLLDSMANESIDKNYSISDIVHFGNLETVSHPSYQTWVWSGSS